MPVISSSVLEESSDGPRLVGGREKVTKKIAFPLPEGGERDRYDRVLLSKVGKLWSYTVQRFPPKSPPYFGVTDPEAFEPFAVGYVELEGEVIVESILATDDYSKLKIGLPMALTTVEIAAGDGGDAFKTFAFTPA